MRNIGIVFGAVFALSVMGHAALTYVTETIWYPGPEPIAVTARVFTAGSVR